MISAEEQLRKDAAQSKKGVLLAVAAYSCWGLFPIYWKLLVHVPATQLICHRFVWSFFFLSAILFMTRQWKAFGANIFKLRVLAIYSVAAALIGVNWLTYVWAVNAGFIVETSLGYFINPLINVLLGVIFLRERLRIGQWFPIVLATAGVVYLTVAYGSLPWIALTLAFSFALYGLVKKTAPLGSIHGLMLETGIMFLPAVLYLLIQAHFGQGAFLHAGELSDALMAGAGPVTSIPLLFFAASARRIPLSLVGIIQYISPSLQFLLGIFVYGEPFSRTQLIGFSAVWIALVIFAVEGLVGNRRQRLESKPAIRYSS